MALGRVRAAVRRWRHGAPQPAIVRPAETPRRFEGHCFVAGMHRSGTTLVEHLLSARYEVATLRADVPENEGQHLQDVVPAAREHGGPGRFAFAPAMHTRPATPSRAAAQRDRLLACWTPWVTGEGDTLVEKSPPNLVRIPWLRSVFPGARFLIVTRDPRAAAAATRKWSGTSIEELVYHWHVAHAAALAARGPDCTVLRYEDLCADPVARLDAAAGALGLPRRAEPHPLEPRFTQVENSNARYLAALEPRAWGPGAWDALGYDLGGEPGR